MGKTLCFFSDDMADFEITLLFHKINTASTLEIITVGYDTNPIVSESRLTYLPDQTIECAIVSFSQRPHLEVARTLQTFYHRCLGASGVDSAPEAPRLQRTF